MKLKSLLLILGMMWSLGCNVFAQNAAGGKPLRETKYKCVPTENYEHGMYLTCEVYEGDVQLDDFEVAVLDKNGECRGVAVAGGDGMHPTIAYVYIHGTSGVDRGMDVHVVYGDAENPQKYDRVVEGLKIDMLSNKSMGDTMTPFRIVINGEPAFRYAVGNGVMQEGVATDLTPELLAGATRLDLRGLWKPADMEKLKAALPQSTLQTVNFSSELVQVDLGNLLSGCKALTTVNFKAVPEADMTDLFADANPNCMVYLPATAKECPTALSSYNVIRHSEKADTALTDIKLVGSTPAQQCPFVLERDIVLNGHRATFTPAGLKYADGKGGWNTLVLPFDADVYADETLLTGNFDKLVSPDSYWLMDYRRYRNTEIAFAYNENGLVAHTPYLFTLPGNAFGAEMSLEGKAITFRNQNDVIKAVPAEIQSTESARLDIQFHGTYTTRLSSPMYLLSDMKNGSNAFVYAEQGNLLPFRGYMKMREGVAPTAKMLMISSEYLPTAIESVVADEPAAAPVVYDLSGRRVDNFEDATPGIYIVNGKKQLKK